MLSHTWELSEYSYIRWHFMGRQHIFLHSTPFYWQQLLCLSHSASPLGIERSVWILILLFWGEQMKPMPLRWAPNLLVVTRTRCVQVSFQQTSSKFRSSKPRPTKIRWPNVNSRAFRTTGSGKATGHTNTTICRSLVKLLAPFHDFPGVFHTTSTFQNHITISRTFNWNRKSAFLLFPLLVTTIHLVGDKWIL